MAESEQSGGTYSGCSSTPSNESSEHLIAAVHYTTQEHSNNEDLPKGIKEKFVRLMSVDLRRSLLGGDSLEGPDFEACIQYCDIVTFAENFVDCIIEEAEGKLSKVPQETIFTIRRSPSTAERVFAPRYSYEYPIIEHERPKFTGWPSISEFTVALGADKIDEYLASFATQEEWLYIIYYLGVKSDHTSKFYDYEAKWSLPSHEYPIAQATASVFFTIEASKVIPPDCAVNVTFVFESYQFKHKPGLTDFKEEWLNYILDAKIGVFKKITF